MCKTLCVHLPTSLTEKQLGQSGSGEYREARQTENVVTIRPSCIVFLIIGSFECEGKTWSQAGYGYHISDAEKITLKPMTAVVIIQCNWTILANQAG
jgi:hypothetical protein